MDAAPRRPHILRRHAERPPSIRKHQSHATQSGVEAMTEDIAQLVGNTPDRSTIDRIRKKYGV